MNSQTENNKQKTVNSKLQTAKPSSMTTELFPTTPDCEIVSERIFDVQCEILFRAWADPNHLIHWWGPNGFTNTFHEFDFREGGRWRLTMHGPDKGHYENEAEFLVIEEPTLIAWKRHTKPLFKVVATFEPLSSYSTRLVFRMVFDDANECRKVKTFAVDKNEENFDRLEVELGKMSL